MYGEKGDSWNGFGEQWVGKCTIEAKLIADITESTLEINSYDLPMRLGGVAMGFLPVMSLFQVWAQNRQQIDFIQAGS